MNYIAICKVETGYVGMGKYFKLVGFKGNSAKDCFAKVKDAYEADPYFFQGYIYKVYDENEDKDFDVTHFLSLRMAGDKIVAIPEKNNMKAYNMFYDYFENIS